jgi:hypothetical protein
MNEVNLDENIAIPENPITRLTEEINALKAERENLKPKYKKNLIGVVISLVLGLSYLLLSYILIVITDNPPAIPLCCLPLLVP